MRSRAEGLRAVPFLLYLYPVVGAFCSRSLFPVLLDRYSAAMGLYLLLNVVFMLFAAWALRRATFGALVTANLALFGMALLATGNIQVRQLPGLPLLMALVRFCAAAAVMVLVVRRRRLIGLVPVGVLLALMSAFDVVMLGLWAMRPPQERLYRNGTTQPPRIAEGDIVIVGDSFVWAQYVDEREGFPAKLQERLGGGGRGPQVHALGIPGAGVAEYIDFLRGVPAGSKAGRIVLSYFHNDFPPRPRPLPAMNHLRLTLQEASPSLLFLFDKFRRMRQGTVNDYFDVMVADYRRDDSDFESRWGRLKELLAEFRRHAAERSAERPVFLIHPLLVDFADYPLVGVHQDLARLAEDLGYEAVDPLPAFRDRLVDGRRHRAMANDLHYDVAANALVAEVLYERLKR